MGALFKIASNRHTIYHFCTKKIIKPYSPNYIQLIEASIAGFNGPIILWNIFPAKFSVDTCRPLRISSVPNRQTTII
jgi:hypothetical protein